MAASSKVQLEAQKKISMSQPRLLKCTNKMSYVLVNMKRVGFAITMNFVFWESTVSIHFLVILIPF